MTSGLRLSLTANIALVSLVVALILRWPAPPVKPAEKLRRLDSHAEKGSTNPSRGPSETMAEGGLNPVAAAELMHCGVSRETLTEVVLQDFERRQNEALAQLEKRYAPALIPEREMIAFSRRRDVDRVRAIRNTLGEEAYRAWDRNQALQELNFRRLPGDPLPMSAAETERAYELQRDFDERSKSIQMAFEDGVADRADADALRKRAKQELDDALSKLLGSDRLAQLHGSADETGHIGAAGETQQNWSDLCPTAEQAKGIERADTDYRSHENELAKALAARTTDPSAAAAELMRIAAEREQTLRGIFGAEAYAEHEAARDPAYGALTRYAEAWDLKPADIDRVYHSVSVFEQQADGLRRLAALREQAGSNVDWNAVNAAIEQLKRQASADVGAAVGPERLRRMEASGLF